MIYILAALLPPLGLLVNGQPISALINLIMIVPCILLGLIFPLLFLVPSAHAVIAVRFVAGARCWKPSSAAACPPPIGGPERHNGVPSGPAGG